MKKKFNKEYSLNGHFEHEALVSTARVSFL